MLWDVSRKKRGAGESGRRAGPQHQVPEELRQRIALTMRKGTKDEERIALERILKRTSLQRIGRGTLRRSSRVPAMLEFFGMDPIEQTPEARLIAAWRRILRLSEEHALTVVADLEEQVAEIEQAEVERRKADDLHASARARLAALKLTTPRVH